MPLNKIVISPAVKESFSEVSIGWLLADVDVQATSAHSEELKAALPSVLSALGVSDENIASQPDIAAWRQVYSHMGVKPSKYRSSLEALVRRVLKGKDLWAVSNIVDCYDSVSVMTMLAMGAHDTAKIDGDMTLRYGIPGELFHPLGTDGDEISVDGRQIVYADESKVCCWLWNHRDTILATVTPETKEAVFIVDSAFTPHTTSVEEGLSALASHLELIGARVKERGLVK